MLISASDHWQSMTPAEAREHQRRLAQQVERCDRLPAVRHVAGVDVGFPSKKVARAAVVVLDAETLQVRDHALVREPVAIPYVPGLLSFRECPVAIRALDQLSIQPDLLLCDGQGIAHPRRLGVASHLGLLTGIPSIGVGKSRLCGSHADPPREKGGWAALEHEGECIGAVVRTRTGVKPLYISTGHRVSLPTAIDWTLACVTRYRLPETTRWADGLASGRGQQWLSRLQG